MKDLAVATLVVGRTLNSATVSTRNCCAELSSHTTLCYGQPSRPLLVAGMIFSRPGAAFSDWLSKRAMIVTQLVGCRNEKLSVLLLSAKWVPLNNINAKTHVSAPRPEASARLANCQQSSTFASTNCMWISSGRSSRKSCSKTIND